MTASPAAVEVEVIGAQRAPGLPPTLVISRVCTLALASAGIHQGHLAIELVDEDRIAALNAEYRNRPEPTDVLSFPVDGAGEPAGPRELGDVVICPARTSDMLEAIVHGVLHLCGMDHETDAGEMLTLQAELLRWEGASRTG
jgi:probable rRNA maturation factor